MSSQTIKSGVDNAPAFEDAIPKTIKILQCYNKLDIAVALFASSLWLPNISAIVKHYFWTSIFLSMKDSDFKETSESFDYQTLKELLQELYETAPTLPSIEDFVPELDWGEVKFCVDGSYFRILYGSELENAYDMLESFVALYGRDDNLVKKLKRDPIEELTTCLQIQNAIVSSIKGQRDSENLDLSPGYVEIPSEEFWESCKSFVFNLNATTNLSASFIDEYSTIMGVRDLVFSSDSTFIAAFYEGNLVNSLFLKTNSLFVPLVPRSSIIRILTNWQKLTAKNTRPFITSKDSSLSTQSYIYKFLKRRNLLKVFPFASAVFPDDRPHEMVYTAIVPEFSKQRITLFCFVPQEGNSWREENYFDNLNKVLNKSLELLKSLPVKFALHAERKNVHFDINDSEIQFDCHTFLILPTLGLDESSVKIPRMSSTTVISLPQFFGLFDEIELGDQLWNFLDYCNSNRGMILPGFASILDKWGSYKSSHGLLIDGANEPHMIHIDPHWGSNTRFETLSHFWKIFPINFFDVTPRAWEVDLLDPPDRVRLFARDHSVFMRNLRIGNCHVYINTIFRDVEFEALQLAVQLVDMLEDTFGTFSNTLKSHEFFTKNDEFHILVFPASEVVSKENLKHIQHLVDTDTVWSIDSGYPQSGIPGIRLVFDESHYREEMVKSNDRTFQHKLALDVLKYLNDFIFDEKSYEAIKQTIESNNHLKPRFKMGYEEVRYLFPEHVNPNEPKPNHFKRARQTAAILAKDLEVHPGIYQSEEAKTILNKLVSGMVEKIDNIIKVLNYEYSIQYVIESIDSLAHNHKREMLSLTGSVKMDVDYDQETSYYESKRAFSRNHRNYRYIIEKFVQHYPVQSNCMTDDEFGYLVALVDWLFVYQQASDSIHYNLFVTGLRIDSDYKPFTMFGEDHEEKENEYGYTMASQNLNSSNDYSDELFSPVDNDEHLDKMDIAFKQDYGFSFTQLLEFMSILSNWPEHDDNTNELSTSYSATASQLIATTSKILELDHDDNFLKMIEFLSLDKDSILKTIDPEGQETTCETLPIWEHKKRPFRYHLRPIIKTNDGYLWGPVSVNRSATVWIGHIASCSLPIDPTAPNVRNVIEQGKRSIEKTLEMKTYEIVQRFTNYAERGITHKRGGFPQEVGEYDVLAYLEKNNTIISIECKDLPLPFCAKDSLSVREMIFGKKGKEGHFRMINKRNKYLKENLNDLCSRLNWPVKEKALPQIIDIYLTRISYWWTKYPDTSYKTEFLSLNELDEFLKKL